MPQKNMHDRAQQPTGLMAAPKSGTLAHVAFMICTRGAHSNRQACLASIARLNRPDGMQLSIVIGDNNVPAQKQEIVAETQELGLDITYIHVAPRGYCYVRNAVLDAAAQTGAEILIFIDDDHMAEPDLLQSYSDCFKQFDPDVVHGSYIGSSRRYKQGQRAQKISTYNVAFRRRLIASPRHGGMGLRFDPRLNLLGHEDIEFFREASGLGARMIYSDQALTRLTDTGQPHKKAAISRTIAYAAGRNAVSVEAIRRGNASAVRLFLRSYLPRGFRGIFETARSAIQKTFRTNDPAPPSISLAMFHGAIHGLLRGGVERPAARAGKIVPVAGPADVPGPS
jgi:hypothetical protein